MDKAQISIEKARLMIARLHEASPFELNWGNINDFIEKKLSGLLNHEGLQKKLKSSHPAKNYGFVRFHPSNSSYVTDRKRNFLIVFTNVFFEIIHKILPEAVQKYPESFGTGDPNRVIEAIYQTRPFGTLEAFPEFLRHDQFALVFEIRKNRIVSKALRLDLFRMIEEKDGTFDFTGGILHAFRHFSYQGIPLSTKREGYNIEHPSFIMKYLINGFFFHKLRPTEGKDTFYSVIELGGSRFMRFVFYQETNNDIYFIRSVSRAKVKEYRKYITP